MTGDTRCPGCGDAYTIHGYYIENVQGCYTSADDPSAWCALREERY